MAKKPKVDDGNKSSVVNFGPGWFPIIYCLLMFWFYVGMCNDGSNVTVPAVAAALRVENATLLTMNSIAGLVGVVFFIILLVKGVLRLFVPPFFPEHAFPPSPR